MVSETNARRGQSAEAHDSGPRPVSASLERLLGQLDKPPPDVLSAVFGRWEEIVGAEVANHCRPVAIEGDRLIVAVSDPMWASEIRWLSDEMLNRVNELSGARPLRSLTVTQQPLRERMP